MTTTPAPAAPFVHVPQPPKIYDKWAAYGGGWCASADGQQAFNLGHFARVPGKVSLSLEALHTASSTFHLPVDLLLPLARALIDAHHHLTQPPATTGAATPP